jgi:hypothetical protein
VHRIPVYVKLIFAFYSYTCMIILFGKKNQVKKDADKIILNGSAIQPRNISVFKEGKYLADPV